MKTKIQLIEQALVRDLIKLQELYALLLDAEQANACFDRKEYYRTVNRDILQREERITQNRKRILMVRS